MADIWDGVASPVTADPWAGVASPVPQSPAPLSNSPYSLDQQFAAATNAGANLIRPFFGQPQVNNTPDLDALRKQGWSNLPAAQKVGAVEDALMASPTGQVATAIGGTVMNLPTIAMSKLNQGLEAVGVPHQYSQAVEMALPMLAKGAPATEAVAEAPKAPPVLDSSVVPSEPPAPPPEVPQDAWSNAHAIIKQALDEEKMTPEHIATKLEAAKDTGLPLTAIDVATKDVGGVQTQGRNILGLADAAANLPGEGAAMAGEVAARGAQAKQRIGKAFDDNISGGKYYDVQNDAVQAQDGAGPLYDAAYKANKNVQSPAIDRILQTPAGQSALKAAAVKMQNDMSLMGVNDPDLMEQAQLTGQYQPGDGGVASGLKLRSLDYVKRAMDDQIGAAQRAGENDNVRILSGLKNSLINELDKADATKNDAPPSAQPGMLRLYDAGNGSFATDGTGAKSYIDIPSTKSSLSRITQGQTPGSFTTTAPEIINGIKPVSSPGMYAQARGTYATGARVKDALEQGRKFMSMDKEEIADYLNDKNVSNPEKAAFATGARRALQDKMGNVGDNANAVTALWKDNIRDRLEPFFPTKDAYDRFAANMQHEQTMARVNGMMTRGSQTNMRGNYQELLAAKKTPTAATIAKTIIEPQGALANKVGDMMTEALQKRAKGMSQDTAAAVMHYLRSNDPQLWHGLNEKLSPPSSTAQAFASLKKTAPTLIKSGVVENGATQQAEKRLKAASLSMPSFISEAEAAEPPASNLTSRMARAESGGNPLARNPNSTASGPLQFTNDTWARAVAKWGQQTGYDLKDKNDPQAQAVMGQLLAQDNARIMANKLGRPPTDGEVYAAHVLGAHDGLKLINAAQTNPNRQAVTLYPRKITGANRGLFFDGARPRSVAELYNLMNQKVT